MEYGTVQRFPAALRSAPSAQQLASDQTDVAAAQGHGSRGNDGNRYRPGRTSLGRDPGAQSLFQFTPSHATILRRSRREQRSQRWPDRVISSRRTQRARQLDRLKQKLEPFVSMLHS